MARRVRDDEQPDVSRVDGPHSPERTAAVARLIAEAVRFLNYASQPADGAPGISYAGDVDQVLGAVAAASRGLVQTLGQLAECLREDLATGRLRLDAGRPRADDPAMAVEEACLHLQEAQGACDRLDATLGRARQFTAGMYLASEEKSDGR